MLQYIGGENMEYTNTGERIREIRKKRGYNQDELAEMASLNRVTIAKYEAGKVEPGARALGRIADALEVTVDQLLGRNQQEKPVGPALDSELIDMLSNLSPENTRRVKDFLAGIEAAHKD
jgi:transcriptional regulator with XRE-family HTH domain